MVGWIITGPRIRNVDKYANPDAKVAAVAMECG